VLDPVRRTTAVKNLRTLAELCDRANPPTTDPILLEAYAYGRVLDSDTDDLRVVDVALVLDLPAEEVTWWALPSETSWFVMVLRLDKVPVRVQWRPSVWPVWNHAIRRPVRIWSLNGGVDGEALDALSAGQAERFRRLAPDPSEEAEQLAVELEASLAHLRRARDGWDDREWQRAHKGDGVYPSDHLWRAVHGYLDLLDATREG
jgi:hypothetical protein